MVEVQANPSGARFVALGMLLSKLGGLVREMILARFFGVGPHADVFRSAMRAPNALQNLLGEQTLSAAFIPFYSRLLAEGRREEAGRFAGAVFGLLVAVVSVLVVAGMVLAPAIVSVLAAGFAGDAVEVAAGQRTVDRHALTVQAVRFVFPMTGFLVLSAWALGVLNSHRRFLVPYLSPLVWNAAIVTALLWSAQGADLSAGSLGTDIPVLDRWLLAACGGALVGGFLQFAVQLPLVLRLTRGLRISLSRQVEGVADALRAVGPALAGRGVIQLSFYVDMFLASWLADGALAAIGYAALLINLPLGAFGMSVAAAELPELASAGSERASQEISERINRALRQSALALAPSVAGYLVFGFLVSGLLFRGGTFTLEANLLVYAVLCAYTLGLLASATSRLLQNVFFALHDTRTPARIAGVRLAASALLGAAMMFALDDFSVREVFGLSGTTQDLRLGAVGLGLAASGGAWCEIVLLRRALRQRLPALRLPLRHIVGRLGLAVALAVPALILWALISSTPPTLQALVVLPVYIGSYLGWAWWRRFPELGLWHSRLGR